MPCMVVPRNSDDLLSRESPCIVNVFKIASSGPEVATVWHVGTRDSMFTTVYRYTEISEMENHWKEYCIPLVVVWEVENRVVAQSVPVTIPDHLSSTQINP